MEDRLRRHGLSLLLANVGDSRAHELEAIHQALRVRADGLAISMRDFQPGDFDRLRRAGTHIISLSRDIDDPTLDAVLPDRPAAIVQAVEFLASLGHRRVALVHGSGGKVAHASRLVAYRAARERAGLGAEPELLVEVPDANQPAGLAAAPELLRSGTTAAVASGDALAIGLWIGLEQAGLTIPDDFSLIGMDDIEAAALVRSGLTTVALDRAERGRLVAEILIGRLDGSLVGGPCQRYIRAKLVVRASTAPPRADVTEGGARVNSSVA
jgi:LacI family transcriptional regulator